MLETLMPAGDASRSAQAFTVGLFSTIDAFLDRPMAEALEPLHFPEESTDALLYHRGTLGDLLTLVIAYERGEWTAVGGEARRLCLQADAVAATYIEALTWAEKTLASSL